MPFESPNHTQIPNDLLGNWKDRGLMADMTASELKVVLAICRLTFGYHRRKVTASLPSLITMTGLSKQAVINGAKAFCSKGGLPFCRWALVSCRTDMTKGGPPSSGQIIIPIGTPGFDVGREEDKMGIRLSSTVGLSLADVRVPAQNLLKSGERHGATQRKNTSARGISSMIPGNSG